MITDAGIADDLARPPLLPPADDAGGGTGPGALLLGLDATTDASEAAGPADVTPAAELTPPPELLKARVLAEGALVVVTPVSKIV